MNIRKSYIALGAAVTAALSLSSLPSARNLLASIRLGRPQLSPPFTYQVMITSGEAPLPLRLFETAVKPIRAAASSPAQTAIR